MKKQAAAWTLFGMVFLMNPQLACSSSEGEEDDFTYTEQDMKAVVLGDWQGTAELDGETIAFTLSLEQASAKSSTQGISASTLQPQCGSRSFVKPAAACVTMSTLPLVGSLTSESPALSGAVTGEAEASRILNPSRLRIQLEDGRTLAGTLADQSISDGGIYDGRQIGSFTLARP